MPQARLYCFTVYGLNFTLDQMSLIVFKVFVKFRLSINYYCLVRVCRKSVIAGMQIFCSIFCIFCVSLNVTPITIDCVFRRDMQCGHQYLVWFLALFDVWRQDLYGFYAAQSVSALICMGLCFRLSVLGAVIHSFVFDLVCWFE